MKPGCRMSWYVQLRREYYHYKKPHKGVDLWDTCLDFDHDGWRALRHSVHTVRARLCEVFPDYYRAFDDAWGGPLSAKLRTASGVMALRRFITKVIASGTDAYAKVVMRLASEEPKRKVLSQTRVDRLRCYALLWASLAERLQAAHTSRADNGQSRRGLAIPTVRSQTECQPPSCTSAGRRMDHGGMRTRIFRSPALARWPGGEMPREQSARSASPS